jgi:tetratricopeptide (TPR) repeat protein
LPPLLTAALIVRDEEAVLGACLDSLQSLVDEVVVVDTGSSDECAALAAGRGASVIHHPWRDDFAEARNVSLDAARGQWILYIDADERVVRGSRAALESILTDASEVAFRLLLRPTLGSTPYREYRLWRNDPRIRFEGVIHEKVVPSIHRVAAADGRGIGLADILLQHVGYEGDQTRKHRRNLPLLRRALEAEPDNLFVRDHLARVLDGLGHPDEAERVLEDAVEIARSHSFADPLGVLACAELIQRRTARGATIQPLLAEARTAYPDNCVLLSLEGHELIRIGSYAEAVERFDRCLAFDPSGSHPDSPSYDERLLGEFAHAGRAFALFKAGRYAEAADAYRAAEALAPSDPAYTVKRQLAVARAGARSQRPELAAAPKDARPDSRGPKRTSRR